MAVFTKKFWKLGYFSSKIVKIAIIVKVQKMTTWCWIIPRVFWVSLVWLDNRPLFGSSLIFYTVVTRYPSPTRSPPHSRLFMKNLRQTSRIELFMIIQERTTNRCLSTSLTTSRLLETACSSFLRQVVVVVCYRSTLHW